MARTTSSSSADEPTAEEPAATDEAGTDETATDEAPVNRNPDVQDMNEVMAAQAEKDAEEAAAPSYSAGADVPTAENVRRYPDLFDDATKERFAGDDQELPETDVEKAQREAAERAEAEAGEAGTEAKSSSK
jgi:hypothetical protein